MNSNESPTLSDLILALERTKNSVDPNEEKENFIVLQEMYNLKTTWVGEREVSVMIEINLYLRQYGNKI